MAIDGHQRLTWGDLRSRTAARRGGLRELGIAPGDVLALPGEKTVNFVVTLLAALAEGVVVLPLNPRAPKAERERLLGLAGAHRMVHRLPRPAPDGPAREGDGVEDTADALLCFTSGTTGTPKGARLSHGAIASDLGALHQAWQWRSSDRLLHALPLFHIHGLVVAQLGALYAGASTIWMPAFDAESVLHALRSEGITIFMGVPTFHHRLLDLPGERETLDLRLVTSGSAPLPAETHRRFQQRFGVAIVERYGMTEVGIVLSNPYDGPRKPGSVGIPLPGVACRITDPETGSDLPIEKPGEVRIAGPTLMSGYLGRPDATHAAIGDGWMHTGDFGWMDRDGYIHLLGRQNDLILVGGFNVYPLEVEAALCEHPAVAEAVVVGIPHDDLGEVPAALVCGSAPLTDLGQWLRDRLSAYKLPRRWLRADELPRNPTGKVDRSQVRATFTRE
jgi:malonyl-CoA/methylmalonyl-CoA synthetase